MRFVSKSFALWLLAGLAAGASAGFLLRKFPASPDSPGLIPQTSLTAPAGPGADRKAAQEKRLSEALARNGLMSGTSPKAGASLEDRLAGLGAGETLRVLSELRQTNEVQALREKRLKEFALGNPSPSQIREMRSCLPVEDYQFLVQDFFTKPGLLNPGRFKEALAAFDQELLRPDARASLMRGICGLLKDATATNALDLARVAGTRDLQQEILEAFIAGKSPDEVDFTPLTQFASEWGRLRAGSFLKQIVSHLFDSAPAAAIQLAGSNSDPAVLEDVLKNRVNVGNVSDEAVAKALESTTPMVRNEAIRHISESITGLGDPDKILTALAGPFPDSLAQSIREGVGLGLPGKMAPEAFAELISKIPDATLRQQLLTGQSLTRDADYTSKVKALLRNP